MAENENRHLTAIAHALNVEPDALFDGTLEIEMREAATLVRLWLRISDSQGRNRVLNVARQEAERSEARE